MIHLSINRLVRYTSLLFFLLLIPTIFYAQCEGPKNNGQPFMLNLLMDGSNGQFDVGGANVTIQFNQATSSIEISGTNGMKFHTDGSGNIMRLTSNVDISKLSNFEAGPAVMYDLLNNNGAFGGGVAGFVGVMVGNRFGYVEMLKCGATTCGDYVFNIDNSGLSQVGSAITGNCASLYSPIPTMSEWGLFIFILLILNISIFQLSKFRQLEKALSK